MRTPHVLLKLSLSLPDGSIKDEVIELSKPELEGLLAEMNKIEVCALAKQVQAATYESTITKKSDLFISLFVGRPRQLSWEPLEVAAGVHKLVHGRNACVK